MISSSKSILTFDSFIFMHNSNSKYLCSWFYSRINFNGFVVFYASLNKCRHTCRVSQMFYYNKGTNEKYFHQHSYIIKIVASNIPMETITICTLHFENSLNFIRQLGLPKTLSNMVLWALRLKWQDEFICLFSIVYYPRSHTWSKHLNTSFFRTILLCAAPIGHSVILYSLLPSSINTTHTFFFSNRTSSLRTGTRTTLMRIQTT